MTSMSQIKEIREKGDRLVIAFLKHDGIFHALLTDQEVCSKVREAYQENEVVLLVETIALRRIAPRKEPRPASAKLQSGYRYYPY